MISTVLLSQVTKPLQDYLGLPLDKIRRQHQAAYHLPKPLYVLYVQADAYREACGMYCGRMSAVSQISPMLKTFSVF